MSYWYLEISLALTICVFFTIIITFRSPNKPKEAP